MNTVSNSNNSNNSNNHIDNVASTKTPFEIKRTTTGALWPGELFRLVKETLNRSTWPLKMNELIVALEKNGLDLDQYNCKAMTSVGSTLKGYPDVFSHYKDALNISWYGLVGDERHTPDRTYTNRVCRVIEKILFESDFAMGQKVLLGELNTSRFYIAANALNLLLTRHSDIFVKTGPKRLDPWTLVYAPKPNFYAVNKRKKSFDAFIIEALSQGDAFDGMSSLEIAQHIISKQYGYDKWLANRITFTLREGEKKNRFYNKVNNNRYVLKTGNE